MVVRVRVCSGVWVGFELGGREGRGEVVREVRWEEVWMLWAKGRRARREGRREGRAKGTGKSIVVVSGERVCAEWMVRV